MKFVDKAKSLTLSFCSEVVTHWKRPGKGKYVPYKEILNLGLGGMGQQFVAQITGLLALGAGNTLLGATLGLQPMHLQYMAMIQTVFNVFFYFIRGWIVDNTRTKWGRFRPYIAIMGFPLVIITAIFLFLDFTSMAYMTKLILTFTFAICTCMISPLLTDTYGELGTVITPNSEERTFVAMINSIILSMAPTLTGFLIPMLSNLTGGYTNINTYRYIICPIAIIGVSMNLFTAFGCKERVVSSKTYTQKVNTIEGCLQIYRNKYWWLRTVSGIIGFMEGAVGTLFLWIYMYSTQDMTTYAFLNTVLGTASLIAMLVTPYLLKRLGNRKLLIYHNLLNIILVAFMTVTFKIPLLFFLILYINSVINALGLVYNISMHSEVKDYQQYLSGKRMDFTFGAAGQITLPFSLLTGLAIPFVYECFGITTNYDILYDPMVRNTLFYVLCVMSIIGATLNLVPFFFYDLSRTKHRMIIRVLHYRAMLTDYENDNLTSLTIKDGIEGYRFCMELMQKPDPDIKALKLALKQARELPPPPHNGSESENDKKTAVAQAKAALKEAKQLMEEKDACRKFYIKELDKFDNPDMQRLVEQARELAIIPIDELHNLNKSILVKEREIAAITPKERKIKRQNIKRAKKILKMAKGINKTYPNGIVEPDIEMIKALYEMPEELKEERKAKKAAIKASNKEQKKFNKTLKYYLKAKELVLSYDCRRNFDKVDAMYEDACDDVKKQFAIEQAKATKIREEKQAETARIRLEKREAKDTKAAMVKAERHTKYAAMIESATTDKKKAALQAKLDAIDAKEDKKRRKKLERKERWDAQMRKIEEENIKRTAKDLSLTVEEYLEQKRQAEIEAEEYLKTIEENQAALMNDKEEKL